MNQDNLTADRFGSITKWTSPKGINIIYPKHQTPGGKVRGECFVAAPVFGEVPQTPAWAGVRLPRHGLTPTLPDKDSVISTVNVDAKTLYVDYNIPGTEEYPWGFAISTTLYSQSCSQVDYWVSVHRQQDCVNKRLMPLSFGLHPYFATHGESWKILLGDKLVADSSLSYAKAESFDCVRNQQVFLHTIHGIVKLELKEFDRLVIWSDNPKEYICIELTLGRRQKLLLAPGTMKHGGCSIQYFEMSRPVIKR